MRRSILLAATILAVFLLVAVPSTARDKPHNLSITLPVRLAADVHPSHKPRHHHKLGPLYAVAKLHHWVGIQIADWRGVIHCESDGGCAEGTSVIIHWNLTATNGTCFGIAQFIGGPQEYYTYGGNPYTVYGQLLGMANYIVAHFTHDGIPGTPADAYYSEMTYHSY